MVGWRRNKSGKRRPIGRFVPVAILAAFSFWLSFSCAPDWNAFAGRAALASAMLNMPEGSIALLEQRFKDKPGLEPSTDENTVTPYVVPWEEDGEREDSNTSSVSSQEGLAPAPISENQTSILKPKSEPAPATAKPANIPKEYQGTIVQENMSGSGSPLIAYGKGMIRNSTKTAEEEVAEILKQRMTLKLEDTTAPQILIVHTHATESYEQLDSAIFDTRNTWRNTDNKVNMVAVGDALAQTLQQAGIGVIHDKTQHDFPSYTGAYDRSAETILTYLKKFPTIKIVLDVHRDAVIRADDLIVKPTVEVDGKKASQLMIITGCEDGTMNVPKWRENLRFAAALQDSIERKYPQLTRPIFFCYRKYNMDLTTGSLLLEIGSNANTLEESIYSARLIGDALVSLLKPETKK